ncbi:hypothetical protein ACIGO9_30635 [Nocardia asteroides]|uniref:hypothetical protein n=1 Tax=Nocardia asteroides TaxID=1824 RepID=UPI0037C72B9B
MPSSYLRDAARRRAARHGSSYQQALQALTKFDPPHGAGHDLRNPTGIDWAPLHGVEVDFVNAFHHLRGVVLPPDGVRPGTDILRVAVTGGHSGNRPAEVSYLDARRWTISPMPAVVDRRHHPSRRRTRGPRGLPLYRVADLPASALATRAMLRTHYRTAPAADQVPIAEYYTGYHYSDLYAVDDAEPLPALPPARQAAWINARTCSRCTRTAARPIPRSHDGNRYCQPCDRLAADDWWASQLAKAQRSAISWARQVVTDPDAVLIDAVGYPRCRVIVVEVASVVPRVSPRHSGGGSELSLRRSAARPDRAARPLSAGLGKPRTGRPAALSRTRQRRRTPRIHAGPQLASESTHPALP